MRNPVGTGLFVLCGLLVLVAACSPVVQVTEQMIDSISVVEPTSIVLMSSTPAPTASPTVVITPTPTATKNLDPDYYYGGLMITMEDVGRAFPLRVGQSFSLYLGEGYTWQVESEPTYLISQNLKITPAPGEQGIFIARVRGEGVLKAVGEPVCRVQNPPCERPSILFQVNVTIE